MMIKLEWWSNQVAHFLFMEELAQLFQESNAFNHKLIYL